MIDTSQIYANICGMYGEIQIKLRRQFKGTMCVPAVVISTLLII